MPIPGLAFTISPRFSDEKMIKEVSGFFGALGSFFAFFLAGAGASLDLEDFAFSFLGDGAFSCSPPSLSESEEYSSSNSSATSLSLPLWKSRSSIILRFK
jgi:hypothetical protein